MVYFTHIVECSDKSFYTGITWSLQKRVAEHNAAKSISTKYKLPVKLVYWEKFPDKMKAAKREKEIKGWSRLRRGDLISQFTLNQRSW